MHTENAPIVPEKAKNNAANERWLSTSSLPSHRKSHHSQVENNLLFLLLFLDFFDRIQQCGTKTMML